jgi:hypothetical protein
MWSFRQTNRGHQPIGSRTIIPVAKVGYLVGATPGGRDGETVGGGSGGGGGRARPVGYIEITDEAASYVEFSAGRKMIAVAILGLVAG